MKLNASINCFELPDNVFRTIVSRLLPCSHMCLHFGYFGDTAVKALPLENTQLDFRHVQPASMLGGLMNFESFRQKFCFLWFECLIK
jgi:hypothetical protein